MKVIKTDAYISNELQLQNHSSSSINKIMSLFSAKSILFCSPIAYNTSVSLAKVTCINSVYFGKGEDRFGQFACSKSDSIFLNVKLKVFKKDDNKSFGLVQNLTMGEADFNQFTQFRNQLVNAAKKILERKTCLGVDTYKVQRHG